jgi:hypothetical protein
MNAQIGVAPCAPHYANTVQVTLAHASYDVAHRYCGRPRGGLKGTRQ